MTTLLLAASLLASARDAEPPASAWVAPTAREMVCENGRLYLEECFGPDGGRPCTLRAPESLPSVIVDMHDGYGGCGGMRVLGTVSLLAIAHGADLVTTDAFLDNPGLAEGNPLVGNPQTNPLRIIGIKAIVVGSSTWAIHALERRHPKMARLVRALTVAMYAAVSAWNIHLDLRQR